jgi:hypothetical protein
MSEIGQKFSRSTPSEFPCRPPDDCVREVALRIPRVLAGIALFWFSFLTASACRAQNHDVICRDGTGEFEAQSRAGVSVRVGAARTEGLAARICEAEIRWGDQKLVVAPEATQLDIDAFGVDMGLAAPVVALQVKNSKADCCMVYDIYSLRAPPTLLRTISGGEFFSAADTGLVGQVEIWTNDSRAVDGFENLALRDLDFAPPVVLRFVRGRLLDVGIEFRPYYDQKIAEESARLEAQDLADFKNSDGRLTISSGIPAVRLVQLRKVKMRVLEIVWCYLYSGREKEGLRALADMWPAADTTRIREAMLSARAHGMRAQVDGVSTTIPSAHAPKVQIYDGTVSVSSTPGLAPKGAKAKMEITPPKAILMERPQPVSELEMELAKTESTLELVIDSAGKVRSADVVGAPQAVDEGLIKSTASWKFIPAFNDGEPIASRILLGVSLKK